MKIKKLFFVLVILGLFFSDLLFAETETKEENKRVKKASDFTSEKSSRMAILNFPELVLETDELAIDIELCKVVDGEAKGICIPKGKWRDKLSQQFVEKVFKENLPEVISNAFDQIILKDDKIKVISGIDEQVIDTSSNIKLGNFGNIKNKDLIKKGESQLNSQISPILGKITSSLKNSKFKEFNEDEKVTFLRTSAKETGISFKLFEKMMNSNFAFLFQLEKLKGKFTITENIIKGIRTYTLDLQLDLKANLNVYKFDTKTNKFALVGKPVKVEKNFLESGMSFVGKFIKNTINKQLGGALGVGSQSEPDNKAFTKKFKKEFQEKFHELMLALKIKLTREIDDLKVQAPIKNKNEIEIGNNEDIRVDKPFVILRKNNDKVEKVGYAKISKVGKTCMKLVKEKKTNSKLRLLSTGIEDYDLAVEYPWSGVFVNIAGGMNMNSIEATNLLTNETKDMAGSSAKYASISYFGDLGFLLNSSFLSEVWLNTYFQIGMPSAMSSDLGIDDGKYTNFSGALSYSIGAEVEKRINLVSKMYFGLGFGFGYNFENYSSENPVSGGDPMLITLNYLNINPYGKFGYMWNPNFELYAKAGYNVPIGTSTSYSIGETSYEVPDLELNVLGGINFMVGIKIGVDFSGPMAILRTKNTSKECHK